MYSPTAGRPGRVTGISRLDWFFGYNVPRPQACNYMTGTLHNQYRGDKWGIRTLDGRQDVTVVGEIVISVSSGFVRGSVRDSVSRDGRNGDLTAYFSKSGPQEMQQPAETAREIS